MDGARTHCFGAPERLSWHEGARFAPHSHPPRIQPFLPALRRGFWIDPIADLDAFFRQIETDIFPMFSSPEDPWIARSLACLRGAEEILFALPRAIQHELSFTFILSFPIMRALFQSAPQNSLPMVECHLLSIPGDFAANDTRAPEVQHGYRAMIFTRRLREQRAGHPAVSLLDQSDDSEFLSFIEHFRQEESLLASLNPKGSAIPDNFKRRL